jgi:hypothetical protein
MVEEWLRNLKERQTKFMNYLELNLEDPNALKAAVEFFELNEKTMLGILDSCRIDNSVTKSIEFENESLKNLISEYNIDRIFNEEKANIFLSNGLKMVIIHKYTFDRFKFIKGDKKHLKREIIK